MSEPGAPPRPGPEHQALAPFVGRWRTAGQVLASGSTSALVKDFLSRQTKTENADG